MEEAFTARSAAGNSSLMVAAFWAATVVAGLVSFGLMATSPLGNDDVASGLRLLFKIVATRILFADHCDWKIEVWMLGEQERAGDVRGCICALGDNSQLEYSRSLYSRLGTVCLVLQLLAVWPIQC